MKLIFTLIVDGKKIVLPFTYEEKPVVGVVVKERL